MEKVTPYYVDCGTNTDICKFYNITAVPSFIFIQNGWIHRMPTSARPDKILLRWVISMMQPCLIDTTEQ